MTANALALPNVSFFFICQDSLLLNIFIMSQVNLGHLKVKFITYSKSNKYVVDPIFDRQVLQRHFVLVPILVYMGLSKFKNFHWFFWNFDNFGEIFLKFFLAGDDSFDGHQSRPLPLERSNHFHVHKLRFHKC